MTAFMKLWPENYQGECPSCGGIHIMDSRTAIRDVLQTRNGPQIFETFLCQTCFDRLLSIPPTDCRMEIEILIAHAHRESL